MKTKTSHPSTKILVEAALMVALAYALSFVPFIQLPTGGSVTFFSTLPILLISLRRGGDWGMAVAVLYAFLQALQGMSSILMVKTLGAMVLCALLDYILAYACLGLAGPLARHFKKPAAGIVAGVVVTGVVRFLCSFLSGILLWGAYAPQGTPVWIYSAGYNASWCVPDVALVLAALLLIHKAQPALVLPGRAAD